MAILGYAVAPANTSDANFLAPALEDVEKGRLLGQFNRMYGDNIFDNANNRALLAGINKECLFHTKAETGKHPAQPRSARRKSRRRSRIEAEFGIATNNYAFGRLATWTLPRVEIDLALFSTAWNFFFLMAWVVGRFDDRLSLKQLLYKN